MDSSQQVLKHLPRDSKTTVPLIDRYCQGHQDLFPEVRSYECFKSLPLGLLSPLKRKSLPEIAKVVPESSSQSLHHFLSHFPWSCCDLKARRLRRILTLLRDRELVVVIDETGDRKKGNKTDYVARQYLGSVGKIDQGIVSVNAYGVYQDVTFPLICKVFKPKSRLKPGDIYKTKLKIACEIIEELMDYGFTIKLVLSDSLYGESRRFIQTLNKYKLDWPLSIRSNHGVWLGPGQKVRANRWCAFERHFRLKKPERRYIREIIFGTRKKSTYWELTPDPKEMPEQSTSFVMTNLPGSRTALKKEIGDLYGLRTWVEYGFRQCKQELGWTDYRLTHIEGIEKWWEVIFCVYLMISEKTEVLSQDTSCLEQNKGKSNERQDASLGSGKQEAIHEKWRDEGGWKSILNNMRLIIQPTLMLGVISSWLCVFPNQRLWLGLKQLAWQVSRYPLHYWDG